MRVVSGSSSRARRRVLGLGAVLAVGLVVGGCTGEEPVEPESSTSAAEESPEPTDEPEPTPTETGPAKPERPAAMEQEDAEGAAAAAEYFMSLYGYTLQSQDTSEWKTLSHESCGFCASTLEDVAWLVENEGVYEGGSIEVTIGDPYYYARDEATGIFPLDADLQQAALQVRDGDGKTVGNEAAYDWRARIEVGRHEGAWVIVEVAPIPESQQ